MNRTVIASIAVLFLSTAVQADEGQASDASASSSTIVSSPVQSSSAGSASIVTAPEPPLSATFGSDPVGLGEAGAMPMDPLESRNTGTATVPLSGTPVSPFDGADLGESHFIPTQALQIGPDRAISHVLHDAPVVATSVPGPAPLLAMVIGLAGLAIKRKKA